MYGLSNSAKQSGNCKLLRITDIQNNKVCWNNVPFTNVSDNEAKTYQLQSGDIVFARTGATVGKSYLITECPSNAIYASYLIKIQFYSNIFSKYIYNFFNSNFYWEQILDKSAGVGQPNVNGTSLKELLIPLSPLSEQQRISETVETLLQLVENIDSEKIDLSNLIKQTKAKVLDLAIKGKLVPQNPEDEPADILLEKIREEKEKLIKEGKLKRDKNETFKDFDYDRLVYDTYEYLDTVLSFSLSNPISAMFQIYYDKTQDSRALAMINHLKYGTNDSKEIMLLRYEFDFEELEWLTSCVSFIDENEIIFNDESIDQLKTYQKDTIRRYYNA